MTKKVLVNTVELDNGDRLLQHNWSASKAYFGLIPQVEHHSEISLESTARPFFVFSKLNREQSHHYGVSLMKGFAENFNRFDRSIVQEFVNKYSFSINSPFLYEYENRNLVDYVYSYEQFTVKESLAIIMDHFKERDSYNRRLENDKVSAGLDHVQRVRSLPVDSGSLLDLEIAMFPIDPNVSLEEFSFIQSVARKMNHDERLKNANFRQLVRIFLSVMMSKDTLEKDVIVRDVELAPDDELVFPWIGHFIPFDRLPLKTKIYQDYLLDLTVDDFLKIFEGDFTFITPSASGKGAVTLTQKFLDSLANKVDSIDLSHEAYSAAFEKIIREENHSLYYKSFNTLNLQLLENNMKTVILKVLKDHFKAMDSKKLLKEIEEDVDLFLSPRLVKTWLTTPPQAEYIISMIFPKTGDETYNIIKEVSESDGGPLNATQWMRYVERYDEYKVYPCSWWRAMVS